MKKHPYIRIVFIALLTVSLSAACIPSALATIHSNGDELQASDTTADTALPESSATFEKSEAVYANLEANGDAKAVYVVNRFDIADAGTIVDYGDYETMQNLTNGAKLKRKEDATVFEAASGTFFYQGDAAYPALPWNITIEYELDGKEITAENLIGATGDLAIHINTTYNEAIDPAFYDSFMLQVTFTLPGDAASNVHAQGDMVGATIAEAGEDKTVAFAGLPKHDNSFELTAKVRDFHMPSAQIVALPYSMLFDMPDTDAMVDEMGGLVDAVSQLTGGVAELASGIDELTGGAKSLSSGMEQFGEGLNMLSNSSYALIDASSQIKQVFDFLSSALDSIDPSQLDKLQKLPGGMKELAEVLDQLAACAKETQENYKAAVNDLDKAIAALQQNAPTDAEILSLKQFVSDEPDQAKTVEKLLAAYKVAQNAACVYESGKPVFNKMSEIFDMFVPVLEQQGGCVRDLADQIQSLIDSGMLEQIPQFLDGVKQMLGQYGLFHDGLVQYASGVSELASNYTHLQNGTASLAEGVSQLSGGAGMLKGGMYELDAAVSSIPETMREQIAEMTAEFDFPEFDPISFVSPKNENVAAVQFIMATPALEKPEAVEEKQPEPELTFWDRFVALFK